MNMLFENLAASILQRIDRETDIDESGSTGPYYYNEFKKIADIFLRLNDDILLSIEVNRVKYEYRKTRNDRYIGKLIDSQVTKEDDYRDLFYKKIIQLNINALEKNKICSEREIVQYDKITRKIICENPKVYVKYCLMQNK